MSDMIIKHQMQPCPVSCVTTCMAMIANIPVVEMIDRFHLEYRDGELSNGDMLRALGIEFRDFRSSDRKSIDEDGVYLLGVPSLNIKGGMHQILIEMADGEWSVFDPNEGKEGKVYYTADAGAELPAFFFGVGGYTVEALIDRDFLISRSSQE